MKLFKYAKIPKMLSQYDSDEASFSMLRDHLRKDDKKSKRQLSLPMTGQKKQIDDKSIISPLTKDVLEGYARACPGQKIIDDTSPIKEDQYQGLNPGKLWIGIKNRSIKNNLTLDDVSKDESKIDKFFNQIKEDIKEAQETSREETSEEMEHKSVCIKGYEINRTAKGVLIYQKGNVVELAQHQIDLFISDIQVCK
jgi:hypothetical protein